MSGCSTSLNSAHFEVEDSHQENNEEENKQDNIGNSNVDNEEDEDEDVDFNPFLRETIEASSSHSSEVEDLDTDFDKKMDGNNIPVRRDTHDAIGDVEHGEEIVMQTAAVSVSKTKKSENGDKEKGGPMVDMDVDGAISMRTRARYSLASFTLDELETFLQETDDEDDLQIVDDEEEYKKFLTAVLEGDDSQVLQEMNANVDEEDENDADFELELEEALESGHDEIKEERKRITRRNRRQKHNSLERSKKNLGQSNRPLRPLLPYVPIGFCSSFEEIPAYPPSYTNNGNVNGFTPHQIGQLHCLIHEHVQLLIQVFSVCVLDPAKGNVTAQVKKLILEMLQKREQVLEWRRVPYPRFCFSYIHPSVDRPHDVNNKNVQPDILSGSDQMWVPYICGPVLSVTDVAPLRLVGSYIADVTSAVQAYKRYQIEVGIGTLFEKEPLFRLDNNSCCDERDGQEETETCSQDSGCVITSSSKVQKSKKTLAATLIEKSKTQSVALVPKEIAKLAQRFWQFFNQALYPRKPPPLPIANRVLFTDAEDELLAKGLMECNTDWKSIQQRFLPCKSSHQIFVRQKNRASSKAPENPIKAVRRMKNSPLTSEEVTRIELGLRKFKLDWISIWRFFVPYRDPSLLPRQWRIATGTQKSYKADATKRAKRRLDDLRRKQNKPASTRHSSSEKEGDSTDNAMEETNGGRDYNMYKEDEAYVHEAFLADYSNVSLHSQASERNDITGSGNFQPQMMCTNAPSSLKPPSNSQVFLRPYRARKSKYARLVKLAPDLPPVNLPPSVRVIPQSAFKRSLVEPSTTNIVNASRIDNVIAGTSENNNSVKSVQFRSNSSKVTAGNNQHTEILTEERVDSDLQMHPLLFQASSQGRSLPPYYPLNSSSNPFTFFSNKQQPKLNLSLFHNPRQIRDAVNFLSKSSKPVEKRSSSSSDIDFHPLLHERSGPNQSPLRPSSVSKPSRDGSSLSSASGSKVTSSLGKKVNEVVDLDIHLSSISENQDKADERVNNKRTESVKESGSGQKIDSGEVPLVASRSERSSRKVINEESVPEIVMEQEELSDSEDEFGDNVVEFEHEEMDDSGDDTSDSDQLLDIPNEEDEMETDTDNREMINTPTDDREGNNNNNTCGTTMDGHSEEETGLANKVVNNNNEGSSLSLNLNSHPPVSPILENAIKAFAKFDFGPFGCPSSNVVVNSDNVDNDTV